MPPHGKASRCFAIASKYVKIVLETFHYVVPKAFHFLVGVRKTILAFL